MRRIVDFKSLEVVNSIDNNLIILSTYFVSKKDPVRGIHQSGDDFTYIENWYESVRELEINAIVFYDDLSEPFISRYQTEKIKFIKCHLGPYSLNDERFFIFYEFVQRLPENSFVVTTDINDVIINKHPITVLKDNSNKVFIGRGNRRCWKSATWTIKSLYKFYKQCSEKLPVSFFFYPVYNPGTIGGSKKNIEKLFHLMVLEFEKLHDNGNYNMQIFNYVLKKTYHKTSGTWDEILPFGVAYWYYYLIYRLMRKLEGTYKKEKYDLMKVEEAQFDNGIIVTGSPFVSMFKWYEKKEDSDCYLIHK
ncbi:hypothetical protein [Echinicola sp. 20G]|uniref:hypothetical protein n=1 Tax=Echinicola sp. 20G TaxID=2781961 RepID=UPI0019104270|nr:hypothetical protein [Echinicola sp. 20G]